MSKHTFLPLSIRNIFRVGKKNPAVYPEKTSFMLKRINLFHTTVDSEVMSDGYSFQQRVFTFRRSIVCSLHNTLLKFKDADIVIRRDLLFFHVFYVLSELVKN